jgi:hypothetical protein
MARKKKLADALQDELLRTTGIEPKKVQEVAQAVDGIMEDEMKPFATAETRNLPVDFREGISAFEVPRAVQRNKLRIKREILMLKGCGFSNEEVSLVTGVPEYTLMKQFGDEMKKGALLQTAAVLRNLHTIATDPTHRGSVQAAIFWAKARAGWTETSRTEVTGADGQPLKMEVSQAKVLDSSKLSPEQREKLREVMEAALAQEASAVASQEEENAVEEGEEIDWVDGEEDDAP